MLWQSIGGKMWSFQVFHQDEHPDRDSVHHWVGNCSNWQVVPELFSEGIFNEQSCTIWSLNGKPFYKCVPSRVWCWYFFTQIQMFMEASWGLSDMSKNIQWPLWQFLLSLTFYVVTVFLFCCHSLFVAVVVHGLHHKSWQPILIFPLNMLLTLLRKCQKQWRQDLTCCPA